MPRADDNWLRSYEARRAASRASAVHFVPSENQATDESELHNQIFEECRRRGWIALHGSMAHRAMRTIGEPDFVIMADEGRVFYVEAKTGKGKLSVEQNALHAWARKLGHTVHVVRSFEEFLKVIQ